MHTDLLTGHFLTDSSHSLMAREGIFKAAVLQLVSALPFLKDIPSGVFFFVFLLLKVMPHHQMCLSTQLHIKVLNLNVV